MSIWLSSADLEELTGYRRPTAQARWLRRHGYRFTVNALGVPVVAVAEVNRKLVGGTIAAQEPNWSVLNGASPETR